MDEEVRSAAVEQLRRAIHTEIVEGTSRLSDELVQSTISPDGIEVELSPEMRGLMEELQSAMEEVSVAEEPVMEPIPMASVEAQPAPVPPAPEPPLGYENDYVCCGYSPQGRPTELETYIKRIEAGTWYIIQKQTEHSIVVKEVMQVHLIMVYGELFLKRTTLVQVTT